MRTMRSGRAIFGAALMLVPLAVSGCGEGGLAGGLRSAGVAGSPDEFLVLPTRPLEMPENLSALPPPTPGAVNRVDYRPKAEAVAGLTGRPGPTTTSGAALVARAGPRDPGVRTELAAEDIEWRQTHHGLFLERVLSKDRDEVVYRPMILDAPEEYDQLRDQGVRQPAVPPAALKQ